MYRWKFTLTPANIGRNFLRFQPDSTGLLQKTEVSAASKNVYPTCMYLQLNRRQYLDDDSISNLYLLIQCYMKDDHDDYHWQ